jgi:hypothetical protein
MTDQIPAQPYRPPPHIQTYYWTALFLVVVAPAALISIGLFDHDQLLERITTGAILVAGFQALFWYACRRCSSEDLAARDGLRYVTAYMTIGVSSTSFFVAVPCTVAAILLTVGIATLSVSDSARAARRFHAMVAWFSRHRMYQ